MADKISTRVSAVSDHHDDRGRFSLVDEKGRLVLDWLEPDVARVIDRAHRLAQQRGIRPIPNRLVLAAFLCEGSEHLAAACQRRGVDSEAIVSTLVAMTEGDGPQAFALTRESCREVVLPMLQRACHLQASLQRPVVTAAMLFKAYCDIAPFHFKQMLQKMSPGPGIDLDQLGDETLELAGYAGRAIEYDPASRQVIEAAAEFALLQGYAEIRSPHLFAALITDGSWLAGALGRDHIRPEQLLRNILALVPPQSLPPGLAARVYPGLTVQKILLDAVRNAQSEGRRTISEADVGKALLADDAGIVVQTLRRMRLDWLAQEPYKE